MRIAPRVDADRCYLANSRLKAIRDAVLAMELPPPLEEVDSRCLQILKTTQWKQLLTWVDEARRHRRLRPLRLRSRSLLVGCRRFGLCQEFRAQMIESALCVGSTSFGPGVQH